LQPRGDARDARGLLQARADEEVERENRLEAMPAGIVIDVKSCSVATAGIRAASGSVP